MMLCKARDIPSEDWAILGHSRSFNKAAIPDYSINNQQIQEFSIFCELELTHERYKIGSIIHH